MCWTTVLIRRDNALNVTSEFVLHTHYYDKKMVYFAVIRMPYIPDSSKLHLGLTNEQAAASEQLRSTWGFCCGVLHCIHLIKRWNMIAALRCCAIAEKW